MGTLQLKTYLSKVKTTDESGKVLIFHADKVKARNAKEANMILGLTERGYMKTNEDWCFVQQVNFVDGQINSKANDN